MELYIEIWLINTILKIVEFHSWNRVSVRYCDGGSFTGDVEAIDPVSHILNTILILQSSQVFIFFTINKLKLQFWQATRLHYRGARIFKAIMEELLAQGMKKSQNVQVIYIYVIYWIHFFMVTCIFMYSITILKC